jgi:hypothetical protein
MTKIETTNKFTGSKTVHTVNAKSAFKALNHFRAAWNISVARFVL